MTVKDIDTILSVLRKRFEEFSKALIRSIGIREIGENYGSAGIDVEQVQATTSWH